MFSKKTPSPSPKPGSPQPTQPARPAGWAVQIMTTDYVISGYIAPVEMPLVGSLNVPTQSVVIVAQARLQLLDAPRPSDQTFDITILKTGILALLPRDEAAMRSAAALLPPKAQRVAIYAGPYFVQAAFRLTEGMALHALFSASSGDFMAVSEAEFRCLRPGAALQLQPAPLAILNKKGIQLFH